MAERREEEEGEEGARRWSSGGSYRPRGSWAMEVATGGGRFRSRAHDGERRMAGGGVAAPERAWDACARGEVPRGGPGGAGELPGSIWPRPRGRRSPPAAYGGRQAKQSKPGERDGDRGFFAISENPGASL